MKPDAEFDVTWCQLTIEGVLEGGQRRGGVQEEGREAWERRMGICLGGGWGTEDAGESCAKTNQIKLSK